MLSLFSVQTIAFTVLGYPMSWIELLGTLFNLWCVWLAARKNILTWPVGLVGVIFYFFLFYQIRLYSDMGEQIYYFIFTFIGWWAWYKGQDDTSGFVQTLTTKARLGWLAVSIVGTAILTFVTTHLSTWFPTLFTQPPAYPWIDAATTIVSFVATYLMSKRFVECWPLWILVDVFGVWLYYVQGVKFIALEYLLFLFMAIMGAVEWYRARHSQKPVYETKPATA